MKDWLKFLLDNEGRIFKTFAAIAVIIILASSDLLRLILSTLTYELAPLFSIALIGVILWVTYLLLLGIKSSGR